MSDIKLELTQIFDAPIEKVWDAWTNPESLKQWKSPEGLSVPTARVDFKVGGEYRIEMKGERGYQDAVGGKYLEIDKPNKLKFTWAWESAHALSTHNTTVTVMLSKIAEDKTEITLIHSGFPDENMKKEHAQGWVSTLNKLSKFLS